MIDKARNADILQVARAAGLQVKKHGRGRFICCCPFHGEKTPSFHLHTYEYGRAKFQNRGHCYGCGWDGDVIAFYEKLNGLTFTQAVAALGGNGITVYKQFVRQPQAAIEKPQTPAGKYSELYKAFLAWARASAPTNQKREVFNYLAGRGLTNEVIKAARLAAVPDDGKAWQWLKKQPEAQAAGLLTDKGGYVFNGNPLLFPAYNLEGRLMGLQARRIDGRKAGKYKKLKGVESYPYGGHYLQTYPGRVFVLEGPMDAIAAAEIEEAAAISLGGTAVPEAALGLLAGRVVVLTLDNDEAGKREYNKLENKLKGAGLTVLKGKLPGSLKDAGQGLLTTPGGKLAMMQAKNPALRLLTKTFNCKLIQQ